MAVNGPALACVGVGSLFVYAGISNRSVLATITAIVRGQSPASVPTSAGGAIEGTAGPADVGGAIEGVVGPAVSGSAEQILQQTAASYGWTGAQWTALQAIENQEAGFNPTAKNPSSGAYGMAQSLGHPYSGGPASNGVNEYGGEGLTAAQSEQASLGSAAPQAIWMCNYIKDRYGTPEAAETFHLANGWY